MRKAARLASDLKSNRPFAVLSSLFLLSGFAALIYQIAWQRILVLHTGVGTVSIAVIVSSFMLGLGLGSHLGGSVSRMVSARASLLLFSSAEALIGLFGALSPWLLYDFLYVQKSSWFTDPVLGSVLHLVLISIPTTLMGFSLPVLVRACVQSGREAADRISILYALNTLGAALGAVFSAWVMIRFLGVRGTVYCAAALNFCVALGALMLGTQPASSGLGEAKESAKPKDAQRVPFRALVLMFGFSGFVSLSMEVLWFRVLDVSVKSAAFTFGSVLGVYLLGLAAGSYYGRFSKRDPLSGFLQATLWGVISSTGFLVFLTRVPEQGLLWYFRFWGKYDGFGNQVHLYPGVLFLLYVFFPALLFGFPTFCMGMAFTWIQKLAQNDAAGSGYRVGVLQASNILGCTIGSFLTGVVLLNTLGTSGAFRLMLAMSCVFVALGWVLTQDRTRFAKLGAAVLLLALLLPGQNRFWARFHGQPDPSVTWVEEDSSGVTFLGPDGYWNQRVSTNGLGISWLPFRGIHSRLGAIPAAIHPQPERIAIVGLGSGDTAWAAAWRQETQQVRVFEIIRSQEALLKKAAQQPGLDQLRNFLADPRVQLDFRDGRLALQNDDETYDLIELDALRPSSAYSGNLYSREFYQLLKKKLRPGGMVCVWAPTPRARATFQSVFPFTASFDEGTIWVGSETPLASLVGQSVERVRSPRASSYLGQALQQEVEKTLLQPSTVQDSVLTLNEDLFPRDEFATP
jgi:spermidine synthase